MAGSKRRILFFLVCAFLTFFVGLKTFPLRTISYDKIPKPGVTFDEFAYVWAGKGLLSGGLPVGWSTNIAAYKPNAAVGKIDGFSLTIEGEKPHFTNLIKIKKPAIHTLAYDYGLGPHYIDFVQPFFDHPPLAGIVYALGVPKEVDSLLDIKPEHFRFPLRYLTLATGILVFILGATLYQPLVGLTAAIFYFTIPSIVFAGRLSLAENVLVPFFLASIALLFLAKKCKKSWLLVFAGIAAGLSALSKFSGIGAILAGVLILLHQKASKKQLILFLLPALIVLSTYFLYGFAIAPEVFWRVITSQATRGGWGIINLFQSVGRAFFLSFPLDGWWTGGFLILVYLAAKENHRIVVLGAISYIFVATTLGGDNNPWYLFPLGALFALAYGALIGEIFQQPNLINLSLFFLFPVLSSFYWGYAKFHPDLNFSWPLRIGVGLIILTGLILPARLVKNPYLKWVWLVILILVVHRLYLWNFRSVEYLLTQWGQLPYPLMFIR